LVSVMASRSASQAVFEWRPARPQQRRRCRGARLGCAQRRRRQGCRGGELGPGGSQHGLRTGAARSIMQHTSARKACVAPPKPIGCSWSYVAVRIGHFVLVWQPTMGCSFRQCTPFAGCEPVCPSACTLVPRRAVSHGPCCVTTRLVLSICLHTLARPRPIIRPRTQSR
jgi:hypothetical protein